VTSPKRIESLPNVPTVHEAGYPDLAASSCRASSCRPERRAQFVDRLFPVIQQVMKDPDVMARLKNGGAEAVTSESPVAFASYVAAETERWARIAKEANATPD